MRKIKLGQKQLLHHVYSLIYVLTETSLSQENKTMPTATCLVPCSPFAPSVRTERPKQCLGAKTRSEKYNYNTFENPRMPPRKRLKSQKQGLNRPIAEPGIICIECLGKGERENAPQGTRSSSSSSSPCHGHHAGQSRLPPVNTIPVCRNLRGYQNPTPIHAEQHGPVVIIIIISG
ncbi:hypothetical protein BDP81DRAFT_197630 [Colletotrichum phormii]|uniref:Uncharacterized protein n=1 Tax=Colletotrichum phormii TaxID=359342 RepID=A0AAI9ZVT6_9PEZI|nr:uncharacterized protein BDP81DRAFT_197630 [Colletotrichum phormii]KAK1639139.1 hypothetical protein BDP81DRAFT_197630 [Colletotrichum phormii]